ncbi:MAG: hypothetical protein U9R64_11885 [Pseudomonadota bacterium]|nr:hypothetical protein [Pseudomonadota bacterium]
MRKTPLSHPASYLQRIARNLFVDRTGRTKRAEAAFGKQTSEHLEIAVEPDQGLAIEAADAQCLYRKTVCPSPQDAAGLYHAACQNMAYKQISEELGVSIPTVQYHFGRASARIAQALDGE